MMMLRFASVVKTPAMVFHRLCNDQLLRRGFNDVGARLKDVADLAGVSFKTVSNVINNHPNVTEKTRAKVLKAIDELNYRPNMTARSLRHGRSGFLAIALPELSSPYFGNLASQLGAAGKRHGLVVVIEETFAEPEREQFVLDGLAFHLVDGIIFSPMATSAREIARRTDRTPMVLLGERGHPTGYDHIAVDNVRAAHDVTQHLIDQGRRRIAAIGAERGSGTGGLRLRGYRSALRAGGISPDPRVIAPGFGYSRAGGATAVTNLLNEGCEFDAIFCFNDLMALGAIRALRDRGYRVPDDVAVAGFDGIEDGAYSAPTLTTVTPDVPLLAEEAVRLITQRIADPDAPAENIRVPYSVDVRESTQTPPSP
jgi:DNA-binding LacI/PurR family transcriptional regulator